MKNLITCRGCFKKTNVLIPYPSFMKDKEGTSEFVVNELCQLCVNDKLSKEDSTTKEISYLLIKTVALKVRVPVGVPINVQTLKALINKGEGKCSSTKSINYLIDEHYWGISCFRERYGNGVWAAVAPVNNHLVHLEDIKIGDDIESIELGYYLNDEGSWLPIAFAEDFDTALVILESKIEKVATNETWRLAVKNAYESIIEENDRHYGLKKAVQAKKTALLAPYLE